MLLVLLVAAAVGIWAYQAGHLRALRFGDLAMAVAALVSLRMVTKGQMVAGIAGLAVAAGWWWLRQRRALPSTSAMPADEARSVLDLPRGADGSAIQSAHRRLIARVHPDAGGSEELASRVNAARDALLAELNRTPPRAS